MAVSEIHAIIIMLMLPLQSDVLAISLNLSCNSRDMRGLKGFMDGLESPIDGWFPANLSSLSFKCCNWEGITCNSSSGRIVKLQLQNHILTGNLSESISNLDHLNTLNLSHNFLKGPLPFSLFHLSHLEVIDLSDNEFSGVLPVSMKLPALQVLDMSDNYFNGFLPPGLCVNSTAIRVLRIGINRFIGIIPPQFRNCTFLEHLTVASNFLSGDIPEFLFILPRLSNLALQDNLFTTISAIGNYSSGLVDLDVSSNRLSGNLPDFFHCFTNLSYFSANSNNLSGRIPPSLSNSQTITSLDLRNNSLDGSIDINCSMMINLTSLDLGSNNFSGTIPASLASCLKLKAINLARNKLITGQVPESFRTFQSLSYLSLSKCRLSNLTTSLKILQHCPNLTVLVLTMNFYTEKMPFDDDLQFKALKVLVLANSWLTGIFPSWLNCLTRLQLLDLSWNHLTGSIPSYLGDLKSLFYFDISNNSLSGEIPRNLTQLESLISQDMSIDESSRYFPLFKYRKHRLQYNHIMSFPPLLDLSYNHLTGPIWPEFGKLKRLHVLDLKNNNLSGSIPSSLSGMRSIEILDLSHNKLSGRIPGSFLGLSFLSYFSVAYNNLTGFVPFGGQFGTFPNTSFEGNPGLICPTFLKCQNIQDSSKTPVTKKEEDSFVGLPVWIGFGTGFLFTIIFLLVIPRIRDSQ